MPISKDDAAPPRPRPPHRPKTRAATYTQMVHIRMPPALFAALDAERERTGASMNRLIVDCLTRVWLRGAREEGQAWSPAPPP